MLPISGLGIGRVVRLGERLWDAKPWTLYSQTPLSRCVITVIIDKTLLIYTSAYLQHRASSFFDNTSLHHMSDELSAFKTYTALRESKLVFLGESSQIAIQGIRSVAFGGGITLGNVLYAPNLSINLFSVRQDIKRGYCIACNKDLFKALGPNGQAVISAVRGDDIFAFSIVRMSRRPP